MSDEPVYVPKVIRIYLQLAQYPILADTMRERMRQQLFQRNIVSRERFEAEAREKAIQSQRREGLTQPFQEELPDVWERRLQRIRDQLTDFYFAYNLPHTLFEQIVRDVLHQSPTAEDVLAYNPEMAPWDILFQQGEQYEAMPPEQLAKVRHNLQETKVVLIRAMLSDQLAFVRVAKEYLTIKDLSKIREKRIGRGRIGGKAAGMILAWRILQQAASAQPEDAVPLNIVLPRSYFIGADVIYEFLDINDLMEYMNQKYKSLEQIEADYPELQAAYAKGRFPEYVLDQLRGVLEEVGNRPLIVRSSSLLEDAFEAAFAGKYESVFCPNQGTPEENLEALTRAIARVYASVFNPDALLYRKQMGLLDFDERMAVLIQEVQGERYRDYFFPTAAGVAYSRNPFIWNPKLRREDGLLRMVTGLGTRAVDRVSEDYPRMVSLSHPRLRPESNAQQIRYYSQYYMDVLNLRANRAETARVSDVLAGDYPSLRFVASLDKGGYIDQMLFNDRGLDPNKLIMTFDGLLSQTAFVEQMKRALRALEFSYGRPVDIEFTVSLDGTYPRPTVFIHLLQCRVQSSQNTVEKVRFPEGIREEDVIFGTARLVPTGRVRDIAYVVFVDPDKYSALAGHFQKLELARLIGRINRRLESERFILMGPGRWGSSNPDLGLKVGYAEIYNTRALIEIAWSHGKSRPILSYGTHFFQDLVEANIYPLAIYPGEPDNPFNEAFFRNALNALPALLPDDAQHADCVKVIDVRATTGGRPLELVMSGDLGKALAFLT